MSLTKRCKCADQKTCLHPYHYRFELGANQYRGSTNTATLRLAERAEVKAKNDAIENKHEIAKPKPIKLSDFIDTYIASVTGHKTSRKNPKVLGRLLKAAGDKPIDKVTPWDVQKWLTARAKQVSESTVNRELNIVRGCFTFAVQKKLLETSPARQPRHTDDPGVQEFKLDDCRIRVLDADELTRVLDLDDGFSDYGGFVSLVCRATLESLARISELLTLRKEHVGPSWVEMRKKGGKVSRVAITPELRTALLTRCHASGWIFGEGATGAPPTQQTASNRVIRALQATAVLDASHHTMRHTGVTLMLEQGINPRTIQKLAGWSSLRMLERYGHARDAEAQRAVSGIASYLSGLSGSEQPNAGAGNTAEPTEAVTKAVTQGSESPSVIKLAPASPSAATA